MQPPTAPNPFVARGRSALAEEICEIGRRLYAKGFAAGNDGNISARLGPDAVLCTPTMMSKGFLRPDDLCVVDMAGNRLEGGRQPSSEILLHLTIFAERPDVGAVVHCHPPHATAFAVAREPIPPCVLPEVEVFLGDVPLACYRTPGGQSLADSVRPFVRRSSAVVMANHGTVTFGDTVERAFWWTEILDAYCRILMLARSLGRVHHLDHDEVGELLEIKRRWGYDDTRLDPTPPPDTADDSHRARWAARQPLPRAFDPPSPLGADPGSATRPTPTAVDIEAIVRAVTEQVCGRLGIPTR